MIFPIAIICILVYVILAVRYYVFTFSDDNTIYIEDQKTDKFRNDDKVTIYEHPPHSSRGAMLEEVRLHRCLYPRIFHCTAPSDMQISIFVISPVDSQYLYPETQLLNLTQTSPVDPIEPDFEKYPLVKKSLSIDIPIVGGQSFVIPKGWWIYVASPSHIMTESF